MSRMIPLAPVPRVPRPSSTPVKIEAHAASVTDVRLDGREAPLTFYATNTMPAGRTTTTSAADVSKKVLRAECPNARKPSHNHCSRQGGHAIVVCPLREPTRAPVFPLREPTRAPTSCQTPTRWQDDAYDYVLDYACRYGLGVPRTP